MSYRRQLVALCLAGCAGRALPYVPEDLAAPTVITPSTTFDLAPSPKPCHLVPAGDPVTTLSFSDARSGWFCQGLVARPGQKHVVTYGTVQLRFGVWDDLAVYAREYDVSSWPPAATAPATQIAGSIHAPAMMFASSPDVLGAVWWTDMDGLGPIGTQFRSIDGTDWTMPPAVFIGENQRTLSAPVAVPGGDSFAILISTATGGALDVFDSAGNLGRTVPLGGQLYTTTLAVTGTDTLFAQTTICDGADLGCTVTIDLSRLTSNGLEPVTSTPALIPGSTVSQLAVLSDGGDHHFLTWWEHDQRYTLLALPIHSDGTPAGPTEVWFTSSGLISAWPAAASVGVTGVVYPLTADIPLDSGYHFDVHLLQRQLVDNEPIADIVLPMPAGWYGGGGTVQLDSPRTLIVGYSGATAPPIPGVLARLVCSED